MVISILNVARAALDDHRARELQGVGLFIFAIATNI